MIVTTYKAENSKKTDFLLSFTGFEYYFDGEVFYFPIARVKRLAELRKLLPDFTSMSRMVRGEDGKRLDVQADNWMVAVAYYQKQNC